MQYEIKGAPMPVVECTLEAGESLKCEGGSMSWMTSNMKMQTSGGGIGKMFSKALSGEKLFQNIYTAEGGRGQIAFAATFPGNIIAVEIAPGKDLICQKSAFLASTMGVDISIFFHRKLRSPVCSFIHIIGVVYSRNHIRYFNIAAAFKGFRGVPSQERRPFFHAPVYFFIK